jgi:transposase
MERQKSYEYPESLRQKIVKEILLGKFTKNEARTHYQIQGNTRIIEWIRLYEKYGVCSLSLARQARTLVPQKQKKQSPDRQLELEARIKLLERQLEDESLLREMYSRMIDIAEKEYKIPIRKKPNTK